MCYNIGIMIQLTVGEFKSKFSEVLSKVLQGESIGITYGKNKKKVAALVPYQKYSSSKKIKLGIWEGKATVSLASCSIWDRAWPDEMPGAIKESGINILNLDEDTAATFFRFPISKNQDPFDLMLAWQAISKDFVLLTKDPEFKSYNKYGLKIVW